jgi:cytochrome c oxidase subunit II
MNSWLQSVLHPAGPDAEIVAGFAWTLFAGGALIFAGVMAMTWRSLRTHASELRPGRWLFGAGVIFPAVVLTALLGWATWRSGQFTPQHSIHPLQVAVAAKMWWWEVRYRDPNGGPDIVTANEIHLPAGRPAYLGITSDNVIHSVWVPALGGKRDAMPGRVNGLTLQADRPGVYRGQCAEYCGEQHARMAFHVVVHDPRDFATWLARQAAAAAAPVNSRLELGRQAFLKNGCAACHTIRGVSAANNLGPDLTHVGGRSHIGAGTLRNQGGALSGWIADPHGSKPGVRMPASNDIDGATLRALADYLASLK